MTTVMMTTELTSKSMLRWGARAVAAWVLALGCGGTATTVVTLGSESHFLAYCDSVCDGGFDCIGGICTRSCMTDEGECSSLGAAVECTNQSVEPGEVAVCDARCNESGDCAALGSAYGCDSGYCRQGTRSIDDEVMVPPPPVVDSDTPVSCESFRDAPRLTSDADALRIVNEGTEPLYIEPTTGCYEPAQALVSVQRDGQYLELSPICMASCEGVIDQGWISGDQEGNADNATCPYKPCGKSPVRIEPGQTLLRTSTLEFAFRRLPRECAEGITTDTVNCLALVDSPPGNYTLELRASLQLACRSDSDCECRPGPDGTCSNGNVYLASAPLIISDDVPELPGQTLTISRERGCDGLRDRILELRDAQIAADVLLPTAQPCGRLLTEADFHPDVPYGQAQVIVELFATTCSTYESLCVD